MFDIQALPAATLLAVVPSLIYLAVLNAVDRYEKEPWTILLASVVLGAIAAPLISAAILALTGRPATLRPQLAPGPNGVDVVVAVVQELVKGALLIVLVRRIRDEFDDVLDGVVYGAALGAGFGAAETFVYALGGTAGLNSQTLVGLFVSGLLHAFYTAVLGAILGFGARVRDGRIAATVAAYGLATAALLHALHDGLPFMMARLTQEPGAGLGVGTRALASFVDILGLVTLAIVVVWALRRETRVLTDQLADEVTAGVVGEREYATIGSLRRRLGLQASTLRARGIGHVMTLRRLYRTEGELAFHKWQLAVRKRRPPAPARGDVLRAEVLRLRRALGELE